MLKRFVALCLCCTALLAGGSISAGPEAEKGTPPPDWSFREIELPGDDTTWGYHLGAHAGGVLIARATSGQETLWWLVDGKARKVMADGTQVSSPYLYIDEDGDPALVSAEEGDTTRFYVVRDGKAELCLDPEGEPAVVKEYVTSSKYGRIIVNEWDTETFETTTNYILEGNVLYPVQLPEDSDASITHFSILRDFDGRARPLLFTDAEEGGGRDYLFGEKGRLKKVSHPSPPGEIGDLELKMSTHFFETYSVTQAWNTEEEEYFVWTARDGKSELIKGEDGKALNHDRISLWPCGDTLWVGGRDIADFPADDRVSLYRVEDAMAVKVAIPKEMAKGDHGPISLEPPLFLNCRNRRGSRELWFVKEDKLVPALTEKGRNVPPPDDIKSWTVHGRTFVALTSMGEGPLYLLDGQTLKSFPMDLEESTLLNPQRWLFELDGELLVLQDLIEGYQLRRVIEKDGAFEHEVMSIPGGMELTHVELQAVQCGSVLYLSVDAYGSDPRLYAISR